uniref:E-beta-farnesene synthase n=1 Tax=Tanacetum cinerariifolium TaxID=118510 RepID=A0A6L2N6A7_TANCI|nr:E-beta-farnesene synthase [Tanacetum cinerariifolium]
MLTLINQCLTGKTSGSNKPKHLVLQMLWGIVTRSNVDYTKLLWEEFVQGIQDFFSYQASLSIPSKKSTPHVIPFYRFTKLIIYYLGSRHNIHRRPESPVHVTGDGFPLGNLKFIPKGEKDEVFGKPIPKELITEAIQTSLFYQQYLDMVARKPTTKRDEQKKTASAADKPKKPTTVKKPAPAKQMKHLVDESDEEPQRVSDPQIEEDEYNLQRGIQMSLESFQAPVGRVAFHKPTSDAKTRADMDKTNSEGDTEILNFGEEQGEDVSNKVDLEEKTAEINEGQAGSEPGKTLESQPPPEHILMEEDQAGPNPGQSHHPDEEHVHLENLLSLFETLSSIKYLDDAFTYGDQFLNDKPTEEEPNKDNVETEVKSMVTANAIAQSFNDPNENKLLQKTGDMGSFIEWYCRKIRKSKLSNADLEDKIDLTNPEGNRVIPDVIKPLPLGGPLSQKSHMVKDFRLFNYNSGMENKIWSEDDKRRSKEFMEVIERRLKIRRILRSLESFVSGSQNQRDLPMDNPLVSVEVLRYDIKRSKSKNKGIVLTEMELALEQTQQVSHYMIAFPEISQRIRDKYHNLEDDEMVKSIFDSGKNKAGVGMKILSWMITDKMKLVKNYRMYAAVFRINVPTTQSQPIESTQGTHRITSALGNLTLMWIDMCFHKL